MVHSSFFSYLMHNHVHDVMHPEQTNKQINKYINMSDSKTTHNPFLFVHLINMVKFVPKRSYTRELGM